MNQFAFSGSLVPGMESGNESRLKVMSRHTGKEVNFDGGDAGLQYRFWNPAENGYASSDIANNDAEILAEEAAFLGLEHLFACRKQCKADQGGYPSLRTCIRACKGKGLTKSAQKTKDLEIQSKIADALAQSNSSNSADEAARASGGSSKTIWIVVGVIVALIIIGLLIYFLTKKAVPAVEA